MRVRNLKTDNDKKIDSSLTGAGGLRWIFAEETFASVFEAEDGSFSIHVKRPGKPAATITGLREPPGDRLYASSKWVSFVMDHSNPEKLPHNYLYDIAQHQLWRVKAGITANSAQGSGARFFFETHRGEERGINRDLEVFELRE